MALGPNNVVTLVNYGLLMQWNQADTASAIELYERAFELDPQNISLRVQLAEALNSVGRTDEAIRIMEGVLDDQPGAAAAYRVLANLYSDGKFRHDKGVRLMRQAFELDPNHPTNSFMNAVMHWRLADYDNTALWMNHIAKLVPILKRHVSIAVGPVSLNAISNAHARSFTVRIRIPGSTGSAFFTWEALIRRTADLGDAIQRYKDFAAEFDGRKTNVNFYYGIATVKAYRALGEEEKAQTLLEKLISAIIASPSKTYHDSAIQDASIYALSGQADVGIAVLEDFVSRGGALSLLQQNNRHGLSVLADDPRFQSILRTVEDRLSEQRANLARWEASGEMLPIPGVVADPDQDRN